MITRRHIRIKVLHHLFAQSSDESMDAASLLKNLNKSLNEVHRLFAWDIGAFLRLHDEAQRQYQRVSERQQPDHALMERIAKFTQLKFWTLCKESAALITLVEGSHAPWSEYDQHFRKQWDALFASEAYENFVQSSSDFTKQKRFIREIYQVYIAENEFLHDIYEDEQAAWSDDLDAAQMMSGKVIASWKEGIDQLIIPGLYKDDSDAAFGALLARKFFEFNVDSQSRIESKSKNWESDRIAKMDIMLMKLCIAEWRGFEEIPVKVSLNEYLDLSKEYSTPKSSSFINGILDKIVTNLQEDGLIIKVGRGMIQ
jgi:N utilization substance protein B